MIEWELDRDDRYLGPSKGAPAGPTTFILDVVRTAQTLACMLLAILLLLFLVKVILSNCISYH